MVRAFDKGAVINHPLSDIEFSFFKLTHFEAFVNNGIPRFKRKPVITF